MLRKHSAVELTQGRDEAFERLDQGCAEAWMSEEVEDAEATQGIFECVAELSGVSRSSKRISTSAFCPKLG